MSGHSKWAKINHKKEKTDSQRGKIFTKIGREISIAVKEGGPDPASNSKLRDVIAKAKANNLPNDNIERSIKKASGEGGNINYEEITYEGYGPGGAAVIVESLTDNRNRTVSDVRHIFDKYGGSMGSSGCVMWMFDRKGVIAIDKADGIDFDELMLQCLEAGAEDIIEQDEIFEVMTAPADFTAVREALEAAKLPILSAEIDMIPQNTVAIDGENAKKMNIILEKLEDLDDVQNVYNNADMPEEE